MSGIIGGAGSKSGVIGTTELDYEEGEWIVALGGTSESLGNTTGHYTKIGKRVFFDYYSGGSTLGSSSGDASFNLPFTAATGNGSPHPVFTYLHGNAVDGSSKGGYVAQGDSAAYFIDDGNYVISTYIDGSSKFMMVSGNYFIA